MIQEQELSQALEDPALASSGLQHSQLQIAEKSQRMAATVVQQQAPEMQEVAAAAVAALSR